MTIASTPLAPLAIAFAVGVALAPWSPAAVAWTLWVAGVVGGAGVVALAPATWAAVPLLAGVVGLGAVRAAPPPLPPDHVAHLAPGQHRVAGRLAAEPRRWAPDRTQIRIDADRVAGERRSGTVQATIYGEIPDLTEGQRVAADLRLRPAMGFRNPGVFDYGAHLTREGIHVVATGRGDRIEPVDDAAPPWPVRVRRRAVEAMTRALPPTSAALLTGLLLGDRTRLPPEIDDAFRRAGVYHVLAVSGFNVALLASSVFTALLVVQAGRRVAAGVAIAAVIAFACVVGPEPSVLRATIMGVLVLTAILLERDAFVMNSLALAALVILAFRPSDLRDPGFQLSFAATAGIVLAPLPRGLLAAAIGVSLAAQLAVLPVTLAHFNQVSTIGVVANLAVVPLAAVATILGLIAIAGSTLSESAGTVLFDAVWPVLVAMRAVVRVAASVPGAVVHLPAPPWTAIAAYAAALALGLLAWRLRATLRRARALAGGALALLVAAVAITAWPVVTPGDGRLRVIVLDVGQGDAIVVETPDRRAVLIDAGNGGPMRLDAGERVVAPFLWNRGFLRLAATVTTHGHTDHVGGMAAVRRLFPVGADWSDEEPPGRRWLGGVMITTSVASSGPASRNDASLLVRLELGLASFLRASDISARAEGGLLASGAPLGATVLKVPHHGARGSSSAAFLRAVHPDVAVISVGARNAYGHPAAETLQRLAAAGAAIYRTDRDGAVIVETDGRQLTVATWASGRVDRYCLDPETIC